jgi:LPXTG-motif cell wall-anchored protein
MDDTPATVIDTLPLSDGPNGKPAATPTVLAQTGANSPSPLAAAGLLLLVAGVALTLTRRRRTA